MSKPEKDDCQHKYIDEPDSYFYDHCMLCGDSKGQRLPTIMQLSAIRHKPTGYFLPEIYGVRSGYTNTVPQKHGIPRLFVEASAAKRALTWWLKGVTSVYRSRDWDGDYDETWELTEVPERKAEDMEVVTVLLKT